LFGVNCVKIILKLCMHCVYSEILLNSGNFPETAWRTIYSHQTAHLFMHILLFFGVQHLAVNPCTARRLKVVTILGISAWTAWQDWLWPPGGAGSIAVLGFSCVLGVSCSEGKQRLGLRRWSGVKMLWFRVWLRVEFDGIVIRWLRVDKWSLLLGAYRCVKRL